VAAMVIGSVEKKGTSRYVRRTLGAELVAELASRASSLFRRICAIASPTAATSVRKTTDQAAQGPRLTPSSAGCSRDSRELRTTCVGARSVTSVSSGRHVQPHRVEILSGSASPTRQQRRRANNASPTQASTTSSGNCPAKCGRYSQGANADSHTPPHT